MKSAHVLAEALSWLFWLLNKSHAKNSLETAFKHFSPSQFLCNFSAQKNENNTIFRTFSLYADGLSSEAAKEANRSAHSHITSEQRFSCVSIV